MIDNLKAAVHRADWYDPEIQPKLQSFATHYGTAFLPTKPYTPRHKGKVESGVNYVQENGLRGRVFESLAQQNEFLLDWETRVFNNRWQQVAVHAKADAGRFRTAAEHIPKENILGRGTRDRRPVASFGVRSSTDTSVVGSDGTSPGCRGGARVGGPEGPGGQP